MKKTFKKIMIPALMFLMIFVPVLVFADNTINANFAGANPINAEDIYGLVYAILSFVVKVGAVIVVFFVIYAGFLFVTAQGDEGKISTAKTTFFWTIIGGLILLGAQTLSGVVCRTASDLGANVNCSSLMRNINTR